MNTRNIITKIGRYFNRYKCVLFVYFKNNKQKLFEQVILLFIFLLFVWLTGFGSLLLFVLYLIFAFILYFFNAFEKSRWIVPFLAFFIVVLKLVQDKPQQQSEQQPRKTVIDSMVINQTIKDSIVFPDGLIHFRTDEVQTIHVLHTTLNSSTFPNELYYSVGYIYSSSTSYIDQLDFYNKVINQFESDSIHFTINEWFLDEQLMRKEYYDMEELENMSKEKKMELWLKYDDSQDVYLNNHDEYLHLIKYAYTYRGNVYDRIGFPDKALMDYERASRIILYDSYNTYFEDRYYVYNCALAYLHLKEYSKALETINEGLIKFNDFFELDFIKGYVYLVLNDEKQAIIWFEKALEFEPDMFNYRYSIENAYNNLGIAYYRIGNADKAIEAFSKAIQEDHNYIERAVPFYYNRSLVYRKLGKNDLAAADEEIVFKNDLLYKISDRYNYENLYKTY